eukprot:m51a1_g6980 hypothetical protein (1273) ;mRNA; f:131300-136982
MLGSCPASCWSLLPIVAGVALAMVQPEVTLDPQQLLNAGATALGSFANRSVQGWTADSGSVDASTGALVLTASGSGTASFVLSSTPAVDLDLGYNDWVEFKLTVPTGAHSAYLWYGCKGWNTGGFDANRKVTFTTAADGAQHTYRVFLGLQPWYNGALAMLKISPFGDASASGSVATLNDVRVGDGDPQAYVLNEDEYSMTDATLTHYESKHVAVWAGPDSTLPAGYGWQGLSQARLVLRTAENAWKVYTHLRKMKEPTYVIKGDRTGAPKKINLYVLLTKLPKHNTGGGYFAGGDSQGYPAMFIDSSGLNGNPPTEVLPHELFHAFQMNQNSTIHGPWWEALADYGREMWLGVFWPQCGSPEPTASQSRAATSFMYWTPFTDGHGAKYYDDWYQFLYLDENPDSLPNLGNYAVTRLLNGGEPVAGEDSYKRIARVLQVSVPDVYSGLHKRLVAMDFANGAAMRLRLAAETNGRWPGVLPVPAEAVPDRDNTWRPVRWAMPQQFAFSAIVLTPSTVPSTVTVKVTGYAESSRQSSWRATLVALNKNDGWSSRYSATVKNDETASIALTASDTHLFLVVSATPGVTYEPMQGAEAIKDPSGLAHPFEFTVSGATPVGVRTNLWTQDYAAGTGFVAHPNGGGLKAPTATVDATAYVGPEALVLGNAKVLNNAKIMGHAVVADDAAVTDNAVVTGSAVVMGRAQVAERARISGWAIVKESVVVSGRARIRGSAVVYGTGTNVNSYAIVQGQSHVWYTSGTVTGEAILDGDYNGGNGVKNGVQYGWSWGGLDTATVAKRTAPAGYMLDWQFANKTDTTVSDTLGFYDGYLRGSPIWGAGDASHAGVFAFDGVDDYAVVSDRSVAFEQKMTAAFVLRMATKAAQSVFSMGASSSEYLALSTSSGNSVVLELVHGGSRHEVASQGGVYGPGWTHVAVTIGDGLMALFVNGVRVGSSNVTGATPASLFSDIEDYALPEFVYIGKNGADKSQALLRGTVDRVSMWRRVLTDAEIKDAGGIAVAAVRAEVLVDPQQPLATSATIFGPSGSRSGHSWLVQGGAVDAASGRLVLAASGSGTASFVLVSADDLGLGRNEWVEFKLTVPAGQHTARLSHSCGASSAQTSVAFATAADGAEHTYRAYLGPCSETAATLRIAPLGDEPASGAVATLGDVRVGQLAAVDARAVAADASSYGTSGMSEEVCSDDSDDSVAPSTPAEHSSAAGSGSHSGAGQHSSSKGQHSNSHPGGQDSNSGDHVRSAGGRVYSAVGALLCTSAAVLLF